MSTTSRTRRSIYSLITTKLDNSVEWVERTPRLKRILGVLDAALLIEQINMPGLKLHKLSGNLSGFWAVAVSGNWRVTFCFSNGEATLLDYVDYH